MNIETVKTGTLNPATYNPRKISPEALAGLRKSIETFGYIEPIIINHDNTIIGGHQRFRALQDLGINECQVVRLNLNKTEEKALNIALNNPHIAGEYDGPELERLLSELKEDFEFFDELNFDGFDFDLGDDDESNNDENEKKIKDISDSLHIEFRVEIECNSESDQEKAYNDLTKQGYKCRVLTL